MALYRLPIMILTMSLLYLFIVPDEPYTFKLFFKLIPMLIIIYYAFRLLPKSKSSTHWLIIAGLLFSIVGDATLHWFLIGLTAFFIGHVFYTIGFLTRATFSKLRALAFIPIIIYGVLIGIQLVPALAASGDQALILPVVTYLVIISLMFWSAIMTGNKFAIFGSLLFVISDSLLSWHMFVGTIGMAEPLIMISYYGAQFLIATSLDSIVKGAKRIVW